MQYVDGYVLSVPKKKIAAYRRIATVASKVWRDLGALDYRECVGDDLKVPCGVPFPKIAKTRPGETVVFAWIVYKSRKDRDRINAAVMKDPRIAKMMENGMPFDMNRMTCGGFKTLVG
jgi:uncharacterized protein YbaA (DUF1428 family)